MARSGRAVSPPPPALLRSAARTHRPAAVRPSRVPDGHRLVEGPGGWVSAGVLPPKTPAGAEYARRAPVQEGSRRGNSPPPGRKTDPSTTGAQWRGSELARLV